MWVRVWVGVAEKADPVGRVWGEPGGRGKTVWGADDRAGDAGPEAPGGSGKVARPEANVVTKGGACSAVVGKVWEELGILFPRRERGAKRTEADREGLGVFQRPALELEVRAQPHFGPNQEDRMGAHPHRPRMVDLLLSQRIHALLTRQVKQSIQVLRNLFRLLYRLYAPTDSKEHLVHTHTSLPTLFCVGCSG